ncbi:DNA adenine methylase [Photorhabdus heterorhabditis]|uniref:DNA methyltransferase n=1 Tax=Photorhabdus heterorhabditis TaxID=880156 RepID=A0ABR5KHG4_9GAMM|nr:DNA adenine methylase [Photorhabdus heterorhabditis]KOY64013.1 hypothetical protein AM629_00850 [Photorhabdus heterorhabditis]MBS9440438.1 hypothetical protein [Photorhabdus heterorhabditis]
MTQQDNSNQYKPVFSKANMPLTMQYLGGKSRIVDNIFDSIKQSFPEVNTFVDLFSGSGVVAYQASHLGYRVIANDIQPYSACILRSILKKTSDNMQPLIFRLEEITNSELFSKNREEYLQDFLVEDDFFNKAFEENLNWKEYEYFCNNTVLIDGTRAEADRLSKEKPWTLFLAYYRNTYFGVRQCAELDFLKELSFELSENIRDQLDACIISVMTDCVSSTTHLAQYLKPSSEKSAYNLLKKRKKSLINETIKRLNSISSKPFIQDADVYNLDFRQALKILPQYKDMIIYADPPYFKEHYSRYYHVLDTYIIYDYPELTFNKVLGKTTVGRYREGRLVSPFGKRSTAKSAFEVLLKQSISKRAKLVISYACSSIVDLSFFKELSETYKIPLIIDEFNLVHTGQGQSRHKSVTEYLLKFDIK